MSNIAILFKYSSFAKVFYKMAFIVECHNKILLKLLKEIFSFKSTWVGENNLLIEIEFIDIWLISFDWLFLVSAWKVKKKFSAHVPVLFYIKITLILPYRLKKTDGVYSNYCISVLNINQLIINIHFQHANITKIKNWLFL